MGTLAHRTLVYSVQYQIILNLWSTVLITLVNFQKYAEHCCPEILYPTYFPEQKKLLPSYTQTHFPNYSIQRPCIFPFTSSEKFYFKGRKQHFSHSFLPSSSEWFLKLAAKIFQCQDWKQALLLCLQRCSIFEFKKKIWSRAICNSHRYLAHFAHLYLVLLVFWLLALSGESVSLLTSSTSLHL